MFSSLVGGLASRFGGKKFDNKTRLVGWPGVPASKQAENCFSGYLTSN